jgi:hypothetical protein
VFYVAQNAELNVERIPPLPFQRWSGEESDKERWETDKEVFYRALTEHSQNPTRRMTLGQLFDENMSRYSRMTRLASERINETYLEIGVPPESHQLKQLTNFLDFRIFSYVKIFDPLKEDDDPDNYYMEREWRVIGNFEFALSDVHRIIIPSAFAARFRADLPEYTGQISFSDV